MNTLVCAGLLGVLGATPAFAEQFTSANVLAWDKEAQDNYFQISVGMAGVVAAQNPGGRAKCVDDWYFKDRTTMSQRNDYIRTTMQRFPDHHPAGVIVAILEKSCGSFNFSQIH